MALDAGLNAPFSARCFLTQGPFAFRVRNHCFWS